MRALLPSLIGGTVLLSLLAYIASRAAVVVPGRWKVVIWLVVIALGVLVPPSFALSRVPQRTAAIDALHWTAWVGFGLLSLMFAGFVMVDTTRLLTRAALAAGELVSPGLTAGFDPDRRRVLASFVNLGVLGLAGSVMSIGYWQARKLARTVEVDIPIDDLPDGLDGFRIVQISDVHVGPTIKKPYLQAIVDRINELSPDIVAITGDFVDGSVEGLGEDVTPLRDLSPRHGTYFCTGNHEYYSGAGEWVGEMRRLGVVPLINEHQVLEHDGARVLVAGVCDPTGARFHPTHACDPAKAAEGAPDDVGARVLLAHQPKVAYDSAELDFFDLQLSGHTHGGQYAPWSFLIKLVQPFAVGLHRLGKMWIYTSRGTGYWGPPVRMGAPSEITVLRLVRA